MSGKPISGDAYQFQRGKGEYWYGTAKWDFTDSSTSIARSGTTAAHSAAVTGTVQNASCKGSGSSAKGI